MQITASQKINPSDLPVAIRQAKSSDASAIAYVNSVGRGRNSTEPFTYQNTPFEEITKQRTESYINDISDGNHIIHVAEVNENIVGFVSWTVIENGLSEKEWVEIKQKENSTDITSVLYQIDSEASEEVLKQQPFISLNTLYVHPEHQGKGIAKALLRWGENLFKEEHLPVFVVATEGGKTFYDKMGFQTLITRSVNLKDFGATEDREYFNYMMIKAPGSSQR